MVAAKLGCPTFFIPNSEISLDPSIPEPTYQGMLGDLGRLLKNLI